MEDEDFLSPAEIAEATKQIIPCYYAYYNNDTGEITDIAGCLLENKDTFLQISYEVFDRFMSGQEQFRDWIVTRTKNAANEFGVEIVSKLHQTQTFKNNMFERIIVKDANNTDITVHWDQYNKKWIFIMSDAARQLVYDRRVGTKKLNFFVTYESSFNFLIRTIDIPIEHLISDKVEVTFISDKEAEFGNINLSTKHVFDNYALVQWKTEYEDTSN